MAERGSMKKAFIAVSESTRFIERFISGVGERDFYLSYGRQLPEVEEYDLVSYWLSGGYAARLHRIGLAHTFTAPGQKWLSTIPEELVGRKVITDTIDVMPEGLTLFAKPAEAKIDSIKAGLHTKEEILKIIDEENISSEQLFQWTNSILKFNYEHRFFILNGEVHTGSPYLIDGKVYNEAMTWSHYNDALHAAVSAVKLLGDNQPSAYTLDLGRDMVTDEWLVVEANPAWSSGPYGADPAKVIEVLEVACNDSTPRWLWSPARNLVEMAEDREPMEVLAYDEASGVVILNN